jgi:hypothetical protein
MVRYFQLPPTFGGMGLLPQSRGGACFCTRGAMQDYDVVLFILALAKTVTPRGSPPAVPGAACAARHITVLFGQKIVAAQKAMTYTALLGIVAEVFSWCGS